MSMTKFERFLYDEVGAYKTVPDDGNRHIRLSAGFSVSDEAFVELPIESLKLLLIKNLNNLKANLSKEIDEYIESIKEWE